MLQKFATDLGPASFCPWPDAIDRGIYKIAVVKWHSNIVIMRDFAFFQCILKRSVSYSPDNLFDYHYRFMKCFCLLLNVETNDKMWIGFMNADVPASFKWADGSEVAFTFWDQNEPNVPFNNTPNCVAYSGKVKASVFFWPVLQLL